ncbi:protein asteroid homolog 1-like [Daphnia carinata]|uniref:protein asteroid homolog 1-like n=1 Tax=Daphnia carinata TaxID=120202 RepID=UPI00257D79DE|nr:protein asteroid homolog 1-like [Daphnia carinata]
MGIKGLSSYIQARSEKCLEDFKLHNSKIVIDGSNLLHFLYLACPKQNACFGGDYNIFCDYVREIFRLLKKCNINAIVVFDGGMDVGDRKQKTRLLRAKQKIVASIKVKPSNQHRMSVLPLLLKIAFLTVLKEFNVEIVQCQYEADGDIASLARGLKCPVVSNDSDFYVMDVVVIPLSLMELTGAVKCDDGFAIQCKIFYMANFLKFIGHEDASIFPLMGTLLGNDYADKRLFENIFSQIHLPKSKSMNDQHRKLQGVLEWLKGQTVEEAIDRILMFVKKIHHIEVEVAIRTSLNAYEDENNGQMNSVIDLRGKVVTSLMQEGLPEWFCNLYADADIPPWVLEVMLSHKMPYQSQVEAVGSSNSFCCCSDLLKAIALIFWDSQIDCQLRTLWRKNSELVFKNLTISRLDFLVTLPGLSSVGAMTLQERQELLFDTILEKNIGRVLELPTKWQLVFATVIHWIRHSHCRVRSYHVDGLVVGLIYLSMVEPRIGRVRSLKRLENNSNKAKDDSSVDYVNMAKNTFKLQEIAARMLSHDINFDRDIVHVLAEFQATFYFVHTLNRVLDSGLPCASPSDFYWGTFIYNAVCLFKGYDRLSLAEKLFSGTTSVLFKTFQQYTEIVYELAPSNLMNWVPHGPNKPKKRTKKPKEKPTTTEQTSSSSEEDSTVNDNDVELVGNRFKLLTFT